MLLQIANKVYVLAEIFKAQNVLGIHIKLETNFVAYFSSSNLAAVNSLHHTK